MFFYTLPLIFTQTQLFSLVEFIGLYLSLWVIFTISAPFPDQGRPAVNVLKISFYQYLFQSWQGVLKLWQMFWPFFILMSGCLYAADFMVKTSVISVSSWWNIHIMLACPIIWWTLAVWRGSAGCSSRWWAGAARLAVFSGYVEYALKVYIYIEYPRVFFNCEDAVLNYFICF